MSQLFAQHGCIGANRHTSSTGHAAAGDTSGAGRLSTGLHAHCLLDAALDNSLFRVELELIALTESADDDEYRVLQRELRALVSDEGATTLLELFATTPCLSAAVLSAQTKGFSRTEITNVLIDTCKTAAWAATQHKRSGMASDAHTEALALRTIVKKWAPKATIGVWRVRRYYPMVITFPPWKAVEDAAHREVNTWEVLTALHAAVEVMQSVNINFHL